MIMCGGLIRSSAAGQSEWFSGTKPGWWVGKHKQIPPKFAEAGTAPLRFAACLTVPVVQLSYCENFIILGQAVST